VNFDRCGRCRSRCRNHTAPIILGGETDYTLRASSSNCDVWSAPRPRYEIKEQLARLHRMAEEKGRDPRRSPLGVPRPPEKGTLREYEEAGIDRAVLEIPDEARRDPARPRPLPAAARLTGMLCRMV